MIFIEDILYDITQPEIILTYPVPRSISKTIAVTYSLSETLYEGEFKWMWLGGVNDPSAPFTAILTNEEMQSGDHIEIELENSPVVVENALYTMSLSGRDRAGNKAKKAFVPGLQYDFTPPELSVLNPDSGSAINYKKVHFRNSELLQSAQMIWTRTSGEEDLLSPHIVDLENDELLGKEIGPVSLYNEPNLNDGTEYSLRFVGLDPAGNVSDTVIIKRTDTADNGKIVVALIDEHEAMLKRIRKKGKVVALESANKNYETKIFGPDRVKVQGVLVSLYRNF